MHQQQFCCLLHHNTEPLTPPHQIPVRSQLVLSLFSGGCRDFCALILSSFFFKYSCMFSGVRCFWRLIVRV
ncbi:hypothetical protein DPMN_012764 [Dreissena polymorpha]|uniref:Uncharacterized protein n=1 Tax=Dreissena polymorpha TaxID=45954 RepID=A0A9D4N7M6_DREPO|nr:hypothetical protein DPMN_012764 [Dreissena polymorpha]